MDPSGGRVFSHVQHVGHDLFLWNLSDILYLRGRPSGHIVGICSGMDWVDPGVPPPVRRSIRRQIL